MSSVIHASSPHFSRDNIENYPESSTYSKSTKTKNQTHQQTQGQKTSLVEPRPGKRGPTTPLTPSLQQPNRIRRKLAPQKSKRNSITADAPDLLESKFQTWLLRQELDRNKELIKFMELERQFTLEASTSLDQK